MIKKWLFLIFLFTSLYFFYNPIVLNINDSKKGLKQKEINLSKNNFFKLSNLLDYKPKDDLELYIIVNDNYNDFLKNKLRSFKVLKLDNDSLIKKFMNIELIYNDSDVATIENKIYIYSNSKIIFESQISLESKSLGLQNNYFGWANPKENKEWLKVFEKLKRYNYPILLLN